MLKNIKPREPVEVKEYHIEFTNSEGGGFSFNATADGQILIDNESQRVNYEYALAHPEKFDVEFNKFTVRTYYYTENASGTCSCGNIVELYNQYMGACQCDNCGRWYNLFGQELLAPEFWEEDNF